DGDGGEHTAEELVPAVEGAGTDHGGEELATAASTTEPTGEDLATARLTATVASTTARSWRRPARAPAGSTTAGSWCQVGARATTANMRRTRSSYNHPHHARPPSLLPRPTSRRRHRWLAEHEPRSHEQLSGGAWCSSRRGRWSHARSPTCT